MKAQLLMSGGELRHFSGLFKQTWLILNQIFTKNNALGYSLWGKILLVSG